MEAFVSYEENDVLWIQTLWPYSLLLIFFVIYKWSNKLDYFVSDKPFQPNVM